MSEEISCCYKAAGCPYILDRKDQAIQHEKDCSYKQERCPMECGNEIRKRCIVDHLANECPCRYIKCEHCKSDIMFKHINNHVEHQCESKPVICAYCPFETIKKYLAEHLENCPIKPQPCSMHIIGCGFKAESHLRVEHENDMASHFPLMCNAIVNINKDIVKMKDSIKDIHINIKNEIEEALKEYGRTLVNEIRTDIFRFIIDLKKKVNEESDNSDDEICQKYED